MICDSGLRIAEFLVRPQRARALALCLPLLFCGCQKSEPKFQVLNDAPMEVKDWKFAGKPGKLLETGHYDVYTPLKDETLIKAVPQLIESAFAYYRFIVPSPHAIDEKMRMYVFVARGEFEAFTRHFAGPRAETLNKVRNGGYTENGVCVVEYVAHQITYPIMAHEGLHQYLHYYAKGRVPAWLNEGLAVQCEGQRWGRIGLKEFDPAYNPARRAGLSDALDHGDTFGLRELLRIDAGHVVGGNSRKIGGYYGQVWALLLFLQEYGDGKYRAGYQRLLRTLGTDDLEPYAQAAFVKSNDPNFNLGEYVFRAFISPDIETVDREFREYVQRRVLSAR